MIESVLGKSVAANLSTGGTVDGDLTVTGSLGVGGDASINLTSVVSNSTIIDATGTEAFLVRANSDGGDVFIVDTTNSRVGINKTPTNVLNIFRDDSSTVGTNDVVIENDGSGDASLKFSLTGATDWFAYVDNSDSDKFKIRRSTSDYLEIDESGNATFAGSVSKGSGSFKIDHPLESKKDNHYLVHSFVESPQADNIYRGKATLSGGSVKINIDTVSGMSEGTFVLLNTDIQCFTSNESDWDAVKGSVSGNILTISCQNADSTATVSWLVIGERQDQHMLDTSWTDENGKVIVEPEKPEEEFGE